METQGWGRHPYLSSTTGTGPRLLRGPSYSLDWAQVTLRLSFVPRTTFDVVSPFGGALVVRRRFETDTGHRPEFDDRNLLSAPRRLPVVGVGDTSPRSLVEMCPRRSRDRTTVVRVTTLTKGRGLNLCDHLEADWGSLSVSVFLSTPHPGPDWTSTCDLAIRTPPLQTPRGLEGTSSDLVGTEPKGLPSGLSDTRLLSTQLMCQLSHPYLHTYNSTGTLSR